MANNQSKVDSLEERISKLVAENDILRRENTEIKSEKLISDLVIINYFGSESLNIYRKSQMVLADKQRLALISQNSDELA